MTLTDFRLVFDFGLLVLIWMVQVIIYPGFTYYNSTDLLKWHSSYTKRISYVVIPLMLGQLILGLSEAYCCPSIYTLGILFLILAVWVLTFRIFVPMHQKIAEGHADSTFLHSLISKNWLRTFLWTLIFIGTWVQKQTGAF